MIAFIKQFIKYPTKIGAVLPSSKYLAKRMVEEIDFSSCKYIVEYGPGTGVFTEEIMKRKNQNSKFLIIEQNIEFYHMLCDRYGNTPNVIIVNGTVEKIEEYLKENEFPYADVIISGIPFTSLPKDVTKTILHNTTQVLKRESLFITFQYSLLRKQMFEEYFQILDRKREICNVPPAYVLIMARGENECHQS